MVWKILQHIVKVINLEAMFFLLYIQVGLIFSFLVVAVILVYQWKTLSIVLRTLMSFAGALGVVIFCVILKLNGIQYKWSKETLNFGKAE